MTWLTAISDGLPPQPAKAGFTLPCSQLVPTILALWLLWKSQDKTHMSHKSCTDIKSCPDSSFWRGHLPWKGSVEVLLALGPREPAQPVCWQLSLKPWLHLYQLDTGVGRLGH